MMPVLDLPKLAIGIQEFDDALSTYRDVVTASMNWTIAGNCEFSFDGTGFNLYIKKSSNRIRVATVQGGGLPPAPSENVLGKGKALYKNRNGVNLSAGESVDVMNPYTVFIPTGTKIVIQEDEDAWMLVGVNYCPGGVTPP